MTRHFAAAVRSNENYFRRSPERLVLEGYRHWTAGFETGSIQPWEMAWTLYAEELGDDDARTALAALSAFIRTLKQCAVCPLRANPFHSNHLCIEECLTIGLVAGIQHADDTPEFCLRHLACPARRHEIEADAHLFAKTLTRMDQILLPVPRHVIEDVVGRQSPSQLH